MTDDRKGGIAFLAAAGGMIAALSFHPSGHDMVAAGDQYASVALRSSAVHALVEASLPVMFLGALVLTRRLASPSRTALAALVAYGFALAAMMLGAVLDGFVAPGLVHDVVTAATPTAKETSRLLFYYNGRIDQVLTEIFLVASTTAVALWSVVIVKGGALARGLGIYGLLLPLAMLLVLSGHLGHSEHAFSAVILCQIAWFVIAGGLLCRTRNA